MDKLKADQIVKTGFGVCRHIAATASVLYETLKERQKGLLLNGTYLGYHQETVGDQEENGLVEDHACTIFIVTAPPENTKESEVVICVVDPTGGLNGQSNFDHTWVRLSQGISFLTEFSDVLAINNPELKLVGLA